jgi:hypothetical protein
MIQTFNHAHKQHNQRYQKPESVASLPEGLKYLPHRLQRWTCYAGLQRIHLNLDCQTMDEWLMDYHVAPSSLKYVIAIGKAKVHGLHKEADVDRR